MQGRPKLFTSYEADAAIFPTTLQKWLVGGGETSANTNLGKTWGVRFPLPKVLSQPMVLHPHPSPLPERAREF